MDFVQDCTKLGDTLPSSFAASREEAGLATSQTVKERFSDLIEAAFDGNVGAGMLLFGVSQGTLRNWADGSHAPANPKRYLAMMGLPEDALSFDDGKWNELLANAPQLIAKRMGGTSSAWLYSGGQLQVLEEFASRGEQMILISAMADNDTQIPEVYRMVEGNLERGVNYLYVVPSDCPNLLALRDLVRAFRMEIKDKDGAGTVQILRVVADAEDREDWRFIDHVLMMMDKDIRRGPAPFSGIFLHDVKHCFEQIYRPGDLTNGEGERIWIRTPARRIRSYLDLLRRWEPSGSWE